MTKREESQQNSNINFKLTLHKKTPLRNPLSGVGLYKQLTDKPNTAQYPGTSGQPFTLKVLEETMKDLFFGNTSGQRTVKLYTNNAGYEAFQQAVDEELKLLKEKEKNEYRKGFNIKSKIFKQTYKFGQQYK